MKACSNIRAVVFDLDGTLLDTVPDLGESANAALRRFGMPAMPARDYQPRIGHGIRNLMLQSVPEGTPEALFEQVLAFYLAYYPEHCTEHTQIYPGVAELLEKLQGAGYALAVLSNKTERTAQRIISHFFPQTPFRFVWGNNGVRPLKPALDAGSGRCRSARRRSSIWVTAIPIWSLHPRWAFSPQAPHGAIAAVTRWRKTAQTPCWSRHQTLRCC